MNKLSVVLAVYNEENNLGECLESIKDIADEIVIVDGGSSDKTVEIAKKYTLDVVVTDNPPIFHINKQKALKRAKNDWILQLDADERVTEKLGQEILKVINFSSEDLNSYQEKLSENDLFKKHAAILKEQGQKVGEDSGEFVAFFIPRLNFFLGKYLRHGGVYPDGVIRLVKKDKAYFPCKSVHEQIAVNGKVGWLKNDLLHMADPTFSRYLKRNNRYIDLIVGELRVSKVKKNIVEFFNYLIIKPIWWFLLTLIRHKGILDGVQGITFSFFSALRFPKAYLRYLKQ